MSAALFIVLELCADIFLSSLDLELGAWDNPVSPVTMDDHGTAAAAAAAAAIDDQLRDDVAIGGHNTPSSAQQTGAEVDA